MAMIYERAEAFAGADCDRIAALAETFVAEAAGVQGAGGYAPDPRVRRATTTYLPHVTATAWLYAALDALFAEAGAALGVTVGALREPPQLVRYGVGDHFNAWHSDAGADLHGRRILSASVELSHAEDHDGGVLEIVPDRIGVPRASPRGSATLFPSRALHHVTPVTRGERCALVAWVGG